MRESIIVNKRLSLFIELSIGVFVWAQKWVAKFTNLMYVIVTNKDIH